MHPIRRQTITLGHKIEEGSIENRHPLTRGGSSSPTIYGRSTINNYVEGEKGKTLLPGIFEPLFYRALPVADGALRPQACANWPITDEVITRTQKFSRMCLVLKPPHDRRQIKRETPRDPPSKSDSPQQAHAPNTPIVLSLYLPGADTMLRQTLARSVWRSGRHVAGASRAFSATAQRPAEVELTVGMSARPPDSQLSFEALLTVA